MKDPFTDDIQPREVVRKLLERDVQKACVTYALSKGYWARKFSSPSQRSVPDYLFGKHFPVWDGLTHTGRQVVWAEEFKAPDKHSTDRQLDEQKYMREAGWRVITNTGTNGQADIDAFKARIDALDKQYG